jgi:hypothetical protein
MSDQENIDNVYYNVIITSENSVDKDSNGFALANFRENRTQAIIEHPEDWELAIERFKIPTFSIPIFVWRENQFEVRMSYNGTTINKFLQFNPDALSQRLYGKVVYNYQQLITSINEALSEAFTDLKAIEAGAPPTEAPFVTYDGRTQLCTLYGEQLYNNAVGAPDTIAVDFNEQLFFLFPSWAAYSKFGVTPDSIYYELVIKSNRTNETTYNGKPYYYMLQEYSTLALWSDLQQIIFETSTIPVVPENNSGQTNITNQIVTDFEPLSQTAVRDALSYYPQGPLRYYSLKSTKPIRSIDISVKWKTKSGEVLPVYVFPDQIPISLKLQFKRKVKYEDDIADY